MNANMIRRIPRWTAMAMVVSIGLACAPESDSTAEAPASVDQRPVIEHLTPRRDAVGGVPAYFEWTRVENADRYAIGLWNDVDILVWRLQDVPENRVEWPKDEPLEPGTYFWAVTAFRGNQPVAESGRAAFVVRTAD
jgi:hypothetical protein